MLEEVEEAPQYVASSLVGSGVLNVRPFVCAGGFLLLAPEDADLEDRRAADISVF